MTKPTPTFTMDEIEALIAQIPARDPTLEGFTRAELGQAIEQQTGEAHSAKWVMAHYVYPLKIAGIIEPKMVARKPLCQLAWTHILGYVFTKEG